MKKVQTKNGRDRKDPKEAQEEKRWAEEENKTPKAAKTKPEGTRGGDEDDPVV